MAIKTVIIPQVDLEKQRHPVLAKWASSRTKRELLDDFLTWCDSQGIFLASRMGDELRQGAVFDDKIVTSRELIVARYLDIDLLELDQARRELLEEARTPLYQRLARDLEGLLGQQLTRETKTAVYALYERFFMAVAEKHNLHRPIRIKFRVVDTNDYRELFPPPEALACPAPNTLVLMITKVSRALARATELEGIRNFEADAENIIVEETDWNE